MQKREFARTTPLGTRLANRPHHVNVPVIDCQILSHEIARSRAVRSRAATSRGTSSPARSRDRTPRCADAERARGHREAPAAGTRRTETATRLGSLPPRAGGARGRDAANAAHGCAAGTGRRFRGLPPRLARRACGVRWAREPQHRAARPGLSCESAAGESLSRALPARPPDWPASACDSVARSERTRDGRVSRLRRFPPRFARCEALPSLVGVRTACPTPTTPPASLPLRHSVLLDAVPFDSDDLYRLPVGSVDRELPLILLRPPNALLLGPRQKEAD